MLIKENIAKYAITAAVFIFIIALIIIGVKYVDKKSNQPDIDSDKTAPLADKIFDQSVLVQTDDGAISKVNVVSGKVEDTSFLERGDFSGFSDLPFETGEQEKSYDQSIIVSKDKNKAILTISSYDALEDGEISGNLQLLASSDDYLCDILQKSCQKTDLLTKTYEGLDIDAQKEGVYFVWTAWDSAKNILFGHFATDDEGDVSPMYECEIEKNSCISTADYDSQKSGGASAVIPTDAVSPSLEKFVMIAQYDTPNQETGKKWELLLYNSSDLSSPKAYDLSAIIDYDESVAYDSVRSVSWSGDEKKIAIGTTRRIFMFDIESGVSSLAYVAPNDEEGDFYWDNSKLFLSPDAKSIAFVDIKEILTDDSLSGDSAGDNFDEIIADTDISVNALKKIDLENSNQVSELLQGEGLALR